MLMCDVALGQQQQLTVATNVVDLPNDTFQSVYARGHYTPNQWDIIENVEVACNNVLCRLDEQLRLIYNEYIVYNPNQVKIKYLFKVKFHFRNPS